MSGKKKKPVDSQDEVIALPPLRMVLVHAKDEVEKNGTSSVSNLRESAEFIEEQEGEVKPESVKKLIEHLEKKKADK